MYTGVTHVLWYHSQAKFALTSSELRTTSWTNSSHDNIISMPTIGKAQSMVRLANCSAYQIWCQFVKIIVFEYFPIYGMPMHSWSYNNYYVKNAHLWYKHGKTNPWKQSMCILDKYRVSIRFNKGEKMPIACLSPI
jgi:hypothetical protein